MSLNRYATARDANEREIITVLRKVGALVQPLSQKNVPDLMVGIDGTIILMEVKQPGNTLSRGQQAWHYEWRDCPVHTVESPEGALKIIGRAGYEP